MTTRGGPHGMARTDAKGAPGALRRRALLACLPAAPVAAAALLPGTPALAFRLEVAGPALAGEWRAALACPGVASGPGAAPCPLCGCGGASHAAAVQDTHPPLAGGTGDAGRDAARRVQPGPTR